MKFFKTTEWLHQHLTDPSIQIIDATVFFNKDKPNTEEFLQSGKEAYSQQHIPNAIFINQFDLSQADAEIPFTPIDHDEFVHYMSHMGIDGQKELIIYDRGAMVDSELMASYWASRLAWHLMYEGFENIYVLEGGWQKWVMENRPVTHEIPLLEAQTPMASQRQSHYLVTCHQVKEALDDSEILLVDALTADQFDGRMAPFGEDRAGHIPGAINIGFDTLMYPETMTFKDIADIKANMDAKFFEPHRRIIVYCGFGVAATWVWLMLRELGEDNVAIYDASLTEWALHTNLPLEK